MRMWPEGSASCMSPATLAPAGTTITPSHSQLSSITAVRTAELAADSKRTLVRRRLPTLLLSEGRYGCQHSRLPSAQILAH